VLVGERERKRDDDDDDDDIILKIERKQTVVIDSIRYLYIE
jgi:hypothetical protein